MSRWSLSQVKCFLQDYAECKKLITPDCDERQEDLPSEVEEVCSPFERGKFYSTAACITIEILNGSSNLLLLLLLLHSLAVNSHNV